VALEFFFRRGFEVSEVRQSERAEDCQRVADPECSGNEGRQIPEVALEFF